MKKFRFSLRRALMTTAIAVVFFSVAVSGQENYSQWLHYKDITINTSATGYNIAGGVVNFPYLVRLSVKSFTFSEAKRNGEDIRFANAAGTHLPYQIELWDSAGASAAVWVCVDQILGNNAAQYIRMHWGRPAAADSSSGANVFNNGFTGVWHLGEAGNDNAGNYRDATANANHCTGTGMLPTSQVSGVIGKGVSLDGGSEYLVSSKTSGITGNAVRTISFWVNMPDTRQSGIVVLGTNVNSGQYGAFVRNGAWFLWGFGGGNDWVPGGTPAVGTNLFVAIVNNGTMSHWYVNGVEVGTGFTHTYATTNTPVTLGLENDMGTLSYYCGTLDEVEITNVARSTDWLTLAYRNQEYVYEDVEAYSLWADSQNIVINTSSSGYGITGDLYGFPYLLRLTGTDIPFNQVKLNGEDIRFASAGGNHLPYEIEKWDSAANNAAVWVKVDTIRGSNAAQFIRMYWGKSDAPSRSNGAAVFATAQNFVAAWHFASDALSDATANANTGTDHGSSPAKGLIGNGRSFEAGYVDFGNSACFKIASTITVCGWINSTQPTGWASIVRHDGHFTAFQVDGTGSGHVVSWNPAMTINPVWNWADWNDGKWHFFASRFHTTNGVTVFRDSVSYASAPGVTGTLATTTTVPFVVGASETGAEFYSGLLDEVVVSNAARSDEWIKLCYLNQRLVIKDPPTINYPIKEIAVAYNGTLSAVTPVISGIVDSLTITPSTLPDYLVFNRTTGAISGWAQMYMTRTAYYVRAYNARGFDEDTVYITVYDPASVSGAVKAGGSKDPVLLGVSVARQPVIFFSVPSPARVRSLQFRMYDCRGSCVWSRSAAGTGLRAGLRQSMPVGNTPSGVYFVEMRCTGVDGRVSKTVRNCIIP
jgi:hypothetical protein